MKPGFLRAFCATVAVCSLALSSCKTHDTAQKAGASAPPQAKPEATSQRLPAGLTSIDSATDPSGWDEINTAFNKELQPDPASTESGKKAYLSKRIARAWRYGDAAMVVVEKQGDEKWYRLFELYNYSLAKHSKSEINAKWPFWLWEFHALVQFDATAPDITFEAASCTECEPVIIFSSLQFDPSTESWKLRHWANGDDGLAIYDDGENVDGSDPEYDSRWGIADFQSTGFDQVAIWTRYRDSDPKDPHKVMPVVSELDIFGFKDSAPTKTQIKEPAQINRIKKLLTAVQFGQDDSRKAE